MATFRLKNLYLSSLLFFLASCAVPLRYKLVQEKTITTNEVKTFEKTDSSSLYKTQIFLFNKYFTGILVDKKTDSITSHLVFVTEIGMKMFDIEIKPNSTKMVYCFNALNKPNTVHLLENDMGFLWLQELLHQPAKVYANKAGNLIYRVKNNNRNHLYYTKKNSQRIEKSLIRGKLFTKQKAVYKYDLSNAIESVSLKHKGLLRLKIKLNKIKHD